MPSWSLTNADEIAAANKYTFFKPSRNTIAKVQPGENVKLIFNIDTPEPEGPGAERMWVQVTSVSPEGVFTGTLDNDPGFIKDLKYQDEVVFEACHIIATEHDEEEDDSESLVSRYMVRCFASNRILRDNEKVGVLYRVHPEEYDNDPRVSGWVILAGDESEAYMADPENMPFVSLGAVLRRDDSFVALLESPPGSAFERHPETNQFVSATSSEPPLLN